MAQEVEVKLKIETSKAVSDVNKLGDAFDNTAQDAQDAQEVFSQTGKSLNMEPSINNLKALKRELKATTAGTKDFDKLSMSIRDMEDAINDAKKGNDDFLGQMENAPGILGMVGRGIRGTEAATNSFSGALKATGIGLIVALLGGLASSFSGNEVAMKKIQPLFDSLKKITFGIFKAVEPLVDVFMDLAMKALPYVSEAVSMVYSGMMAYFTFLKEAGGGAMQILKGVFTLDGDAISAGLDKVTGSFGKAGDTYKKSIKAFGEGEKQLTDAEKEALEKRREAQEKAKEAREKAQAEADAKRQKEIEAQQAFNKEITDLEKNKYEKLRDIQAKSEEEKLDLQAQRDLEEIEALRKKGADVALLMKQYNETYIQLDKELQKKLAKDKADKQKEIDDKEKEKKKEKDQKTLEDKLLGFQLEMENETVSFESKKQLILDREALLLQDQTLTENQRQKIHKESVDAQMAIDQAKFQGQQALYAKTSETLTKGADLLGKNTAAGKSMAVAAALINTYQGITAELATKTVTPFEIGLKIANVGIIAATGFKAVKNILAVKTPGGGGSGGGGSMGSISTPATVTPNVNVVGASRTNAIAETIAQQGQQPIKAYVVANDVTTQQGLNRSIVTSASIG
ncbi:MAG: hypothetical protein RL308_1556 [Bacteroidota bacterium]|jgi:hypothetical protein